MRKTLLNASILVVLLSATGCAGVSGPNWFNPGPAQFQQAQANRFDPYPEDDLGPELVGVRPRDFQEPRAEPTRARWNPLTWLRGFSSGPAQ